MVFSGPKVKEPRALESPINPIRGPDHKTPKGMEMPDMTPQNKPVLKGTLGTGHPVQAPKEEGKLPTKDGLVEAGPTPDVRPDGRCDEKLPGTDKKWFS